MELLVIAFFFGLATAVVGKIKGSSFLIWFLVGFCLPILGLIGAILYRWERHEPVRACPRCAAKLKISDQVCMSCGEDLDWPEQVATPPPSR
jgi:hypothetical protein